jgi:hypothetical protein
MRHPEKGEYLCWPCNKLSPFVDATDPVLLKLLPDQAYDKITHRNETGYYPYTAFDGTKIRVAQYTRLYDGVTDFLVPESDLKTLVPPLTLDLLMHPEALLERWSWGFFYEFWQPEGSTQMVGNVVMGHSLRLLVAIGVVELPTNLEMR